MEQSDQDAILWIKVIPSSSQNALAGWENGELKIRLKANPEKGEANRELIHFLAQVFNMPKRDIILLQGMTSRHKKIRLVGKSTFELFQNPKDPHDDKRRDKPT